MTGTLFFAIWLSSTIGVLNLFDTNERTIPPIKITNIAIIDKNSFDIFTLSSIEVTGIFIYKL